MAGDGRQAGEASLQYDRLTVTLTPGVRLGPHEIVAPLGVGGMSDVYRAHDSRLGRDVAIKVPAGALADPARLHRFEQEARSVDALSHPNIIALCDVGSGDPRELLSASGAGGMGKGHSARSIFDLAMFDCRCEAE